MGIIEYEKREKVIKDNLYDLYELYSQHKLLFEYYKKHKTLKSEDEIKERMEYIGKNKIAQRNELETLMWVLGYGEKSDD